MFDRSKAVALDKKHSTALARAHIVLIQPDRRMYTDMITPMKLISEMDMR